MTNETSWTSWNLARTESKLRYLMSDLSDAVARGEMTSDEANAQYERTATRWMTDL